MVGRKKNGNRCGGGEGGRNRARLIYSALILCTLVYPPCPLCAVAFLPLGPLSLLFCLVYPLLPFVPFCLVYLNFGMFAFCLLALGILPFVFPIEGQLSARLLGASFIAGRLLQYVPYCRVCPVFVTTGSHELM